MHVMISTPHKEDEFNSSNISDFIRFYHVPGSDYLGGMSEKLL